ncbi:hypothetical protein EDB85DRAFT_1900541 [Lactarius pseudohatsudake]|nr:hypothetical protein EDB85DRAFT_1900541 [Lactarius pseudohatsudake]
MARKGVGELTKDETALLVIAAKFIAALERLVASPPTSEELAGLTQMVSVELRAVGAIFNKKDEGSKMPRVHHVIQMISKEWRSAKSEARVPDWDQITLDDVADLCERMRDAYPDWHESLVSPDLSEYLIGIEPSKMWWLAEDEEDGDDVVMLDAPPPPSTSQSSLAPPKSTINTRAAKGKAPAIPTPAPPPAPQSRPRARKRRADDSPDAPHIKSESITPRKSTHPQVEVVITSPPRQGKRTRRDKAHLWPQDRCGPCIERGDEECVSQATGKRITTACVGCATIHKTCNPTAAWAATGSRTADARSASSARTRTPSAVADAQIEALTQQVQDMSVELSEVKKILDISLEENRRGREESREESRRGHEEARRGRAEFRTARQYMHDTVLMGIVSASIPGVGQLPASRSRSRSPANPSTTSPGIPLSTLKISDARSAASSRTSSATSERRRAIDIPATSAAGSLASHRASPSGPLPSASVAGSRPASPSGPLPEPSAGLSGGSVSSRKSSPGQQVPQ